MSHRQEPSPFPYILTLNMAVKWDHQAGPPPPPPSLLSVQMGNFRDHPDVPAVSVLQLSGLLFL